MLCKARWAQMPAERAHTFLATPSRMQNHRSKERRAAQRRLYSRLSTLKRRTSCGRGTPCVNTISEAIPSIMLRETPDDRRVAAPGLHLTHGRVLYDNCGRLEFFLNDYKNNNNKGPGARAGHFPSFFSLFYNAKNPFFRKIHSFSKPVPLPPVRKS